jgi:hypothetical protein
MPRTTKLEPRALSTGADDAPGVSDEDDGTLTDRIPLPSPPDHTTARLPPVAPADSAAPTHRRRRMAALLGVGTAALVAVLAVTASWPDGGDEQAVGAEAPAAGGPEAPATVADPQAAASVGDTPPLVASTAPSAGPAPEAGLGRGGSDEQQPLPPVAPTPTVAATLPRRTIDLDSPDERGSLDESHPRQPPPPPPPARPGGYGGNPYLSGD